mmetsp:Transcript_35947/g.89591  ORF Transcript_35947/g.89591 Transcript_35947/m.89591 type:complete len:244 (+) Transcript_35947:368-1099(+)
MWKISPPAAPGQQLPSPPRTAAGSHAPARTRGGRRSSGPGRGGRSARRCWSPQQPPETRRKTSAAAALSKCAGPPPWPTTPPFSTTPAPPPLSAPALSSYRRECSTPARPPSSPAAPHTHTPGASRGSHGRARASTGADSAPQSTPQVSPAALCVVVSIAEPYVRRGEGGGAAAAAALSSACGFVVSRRVGRNAHPGREKTKSAMSARARGCRLQQRWQRPTERRGRPDGKRGTSYAVVPGMV